MAKNKPIRVNKSTINALAPPKSGRTYHYDIKTPGFAVCVTPSGTKTFYMVKKVDGLAVRFRLGKCNEISVEQARKMVMEKLAEIARGDNPQKKRQVARKGTLISDVLDHWMVYAKLHKKSWDGDQFIVDKHLGKLANKRLNDLTRHDVITLHTSIFKNSGPYMANRTLALLRAAINKAKSELNWKGDNPCIGVKAFKEETRDRFLQPEELPRFFEALEEEESVLRDFFLLCLLTGARRGNVAGMQWSELRQTVWRIPDTKGGNPVLVPLVPEAVAVLAKRREEVDEDCPWVFPSKRSKTGHLADPKTAWKRICERAKLEDLRIHDLRRTLGSWLAMGGASLPIIGKALGHGMNSKATAVYARLMLDPVREQLENATSAILANMNGYANENDSGEPLSELLNPKKSPSDI